MCCCDIQAHSHDERMSLVLASLSSSFCIYNSKICDTKKCPVSCVLWPLWPLLGSRKILQDLRVTFLLFAVNYFLMILCFSVFLSVIVPFLCFPKHNSFPLFVQGLVDKCMSMWRITVVAQSRHVWEIKEASFNKQYVKQSVRWSIFSAELLSDFHRKLKKHHLLCVKKAEY